MVRVTPKFRTLRVWRCALRLSQGCDGDDSGAGCGLRLLRVVAAWDRVDRGNRHNERGPTGGGSGGAGDGRWPVPSAGGYGGVGGRGPERVPAEGALGVDARRGRRGDRRVAAEDGLDMMARMFPVPRAYKR